MNVLEYYVGDTLRSFQVFLDSLKSTDPIGSDKMRSSCCALCSSINNLIEYLYLERKESIDSGYEVSTKNEFIRKLVAETHDLGEYKVDGSVLKLVLEAGNAYKHKAIDRYNLYISDVSQVKEAFIAIWRGDSEKPYYSIEKGVVVLDDNGFLHNLESLSLLGLEVVTLLLQDLNVIDSTPDLRKDYREFDLTRSEADKTFIRNRDICEIPQYTGDGKPLLLIQVFDERMPLKIRDKKPEDRVSLKVTVPVRVVKNPYVNSPRD